VWQARHLATWTSTLRGRCDNYGIWWRAWFPVDAAVAAPVCVASVALGDICLHFTWQAWHLATWTLTLSVAGVTNTASGGALGSQWTPRSPRLFAWQAWHWATSAITLRGRCDNYGIWWRSWFPVDAAVAAPVCVASVALGDICLQFAWQAWHLAWQAWHLATSAFTLRGRRGAWRHGPPLCMAGVTITASGGALGSQ